MGRVEFSPRGPGDVEGPARQPLGENRITIPIPIEATALILAAVEKDEEVATQRVLLEV